MMNNISEVSIGIFGFGNMGQAIYKLLLGSKQQIVVYSKGVSNIKGAKCVNNFNDLTTQSDIIFLAIKPQDFKQLEPIKINNKKIIISIMAGITIKKIREKFSTYRIIRTMPNLNLLIGESLTGWNTQKKYFTRKELSKINDILSLFGKTQLLSKENSLDKITAISGSGPAYVFLFIDSLISGAELLGFDKKQAQEIVYQTVLGSTLFASNNLNNLGELVDKVTSKGGTTEAALNIINKNQFRDKWKKAILGAYKKSRELS